MIVDEDDYLAHYGILRRSGRYPYGSSGNADATMDEIGTFLGMIDKLKKSVDPKILNDPTKLTAHIAGLISAIENQLNSLEPEDALIATDYVDYKLVAPGGDGAGVGELLKSVHGILQDRVTASLKSLPAVLGRDTSSGSATTSSMLF